MFRIDTANASASLPTPGAPGTSGYFYNGDFSINAFPTDVDGDWLDAVQEEIAYVITQNGGTLSKTDHQQLYDAATNMIGGITGFITAVVQDVTPELGNTLITNGYNFVSSSGIDIVIQPGTGGKILFSAPFPLSNSINTKIASAIQYSGNTGTELLFSTGALTLKYNGTTVADFTASGMRLGGTGARVEGFTDDTTMVGDSSTLLNCEHGIRQYANRTMVDGYTAVYNFAWDGTLSAGGFGYSLADGRGESYWPTSGGPASALVENLILQTTALIPFFFGLTGNYTLNVWVDVAPGIGETYKFGPGGGSGIDFITISGTATSGTFLSSSLPGSEGGPWPMFLRISGSTTPTRVAWQYVYTFS